MRSLIIVYLVKHSSSPVLELCIYTTIPFFFLISMEKFFRTSSIFLLMSFAKAYFVSIEAGARLGILIGLFPE